MKPFTISPGFSDTEWADRITKRPKEILSSNSKLSADGIYNLTMPAWKASVVVGGKLQEFSTCPNAGTCVKICYASAGGYIFSSSMIKHTQNLQYLLDDPFSFVDQINKEIRSKVKHVKKFRALRFNDSGDIFGDLYWNAIKHISNANPNVQFYCYTKQVTYMKEKQAMSDFPKNLTCVFSYGGKEDHLIDTRKDRHARVFANRKALRAAGYSDGSNSDRMAANPRYMKIGLIVHNNHLTMPKMRKFVAEHMMK